jgi:hypothetical protein
MKTARFLVLASAALIAATSAVVAGPTHVTRLDRNAPRVEPLQFDQITPIHYSKKKHHHSRHARHARHRYRAPTFNPGAAAVGTARGALDLGAATAAGAASVVTRGWCDLWGRCYYRHPHHYSYRHR